MVGMKLGQRPAMSESHLVEVSPCGYIAACLVPWCRKPATRTLRYLDKQFTEGFDTTDLKDSKALLQELTS